MLNKKFFSSVAATLIFMFMLSGYAFAAVEKRVVRIAHSQPEDHPQHIALLAMEKYIEGHLGDKYDVQIFPNDALGIQTETIELTRTGNIDMVIVSAAIMEDINGIYKLFSIPYLFSSEKAYVATMQDTNLMKDIYTATDEIGIRVLTWYTAGQRSFYAKKPIRTPDDMKGLMIRVQQSPTGMAMVKALGAYPIPIAFSEIYDVAKLGTLDGAENNEVTLTVNKHGEVFKYYSYDSHQMIPDLLFVNLRFLESLPPEDLEIFQDAARLSTELELEVWKIQMSESKRIATENMHVEFIEVDSNLFKAKMANLRKKIFSDNPEVKKYYDHIQAVKNNS